MRSSSYQAKPSENFFTLKESLSSQSFYLIKKSGPTVFHLKDESGEIFKVSLGNPHECTCCNSKITSEISLCVHKLFCVLKVLRIDEKNPISWQNSFTDNEINQALNESIKQPKVNRNHKAMRNQDKDSIAEDKAPGVIRQVLTDSEDDICPICQDTMKSNSRLTWCRKGCGNNIHAKCMSLYAQFNSSQKEKTVLCPLCRIDWGPTAMHDIKEDCKAPVNSKTICVSISCKRCKLPLRSNFYRCFECSQKWGADPLCKNLPFDYCSPCYESIYKEKDHSKHHFLKSDASLSTDDFLWEPVIKEPNYSHEFISDLQNREFNAADYDILLGLGPRQNISLTCFIINILNSSSDNVNTCWCNNHNSNSISYRQDNVRLPCCGHSVHKICIKEEIDKILSENHSKISKIKCPSNSCQKFIFRGLNRRKVKTKITNSASSIEFSENFPLAQTIPFLPQIETINLSNKLFPVSNDLKALDKTNLTKIISSRLHKNRLKLKPLLQMQNRDREQLISMPICVNSYKSSSYLEEKDFESINFKPFNPVKSNKLNMIDKLKKSFPNKNRGIKFQPELDIESFGTSLRISSFSAPNSG